MSSYKPFLAGDKNRLIIFWIGVAITLFAGTVATYNFVRFSTWEEAGVVRTVPSDQPCGGARGWPKTYATVYYQVNGNEYNKRFCVDSDSQVRVVTYNPELPSDVVINAAPMYHMVALLFVGIGLVCVFGALFAKNDKGSTSTKGL